MATIRVQHDKDFNKVNTNVELNVLQNSKLSLKSKGLYSFMKLKNYIFFNELDFLGHNDGIESIHNGLIELVNGGIIKNSQNNAISYMFLDKTEELLADFGYVYVFCDNYNNYKIGKTNNLFSRYRQYISHLPYDPIIIKIFTTKNMSKTEKELHILFNSKKINREWFNLDEKDLNIVNNYTSNEILEVR